jgi:hypothetical protein
LTALQRQKSGQIIPNQWTWSKPMDLLPSTAGDMLKELVSDEVRNVVADAIASGGTLRIGPHAKRLTESYLGSGLSQRQIADEFILAGSRAHVALEI